MNCERVNSREKKHVVKCLRSRRPLALQSRFSCYGRHRRLNFMTRWNNNDPFCTPFTVSLLFIHPHVAQSTNIQLRSSVSLILPFPRAFCFSHTLTASFLPSSRQLLFNSGRPDLLLITALPSRTRAENSTRLFSPAAAMASSAKYTPTDINTGNHCSDSQFYSLPALGVTPTGSAGFLHIFSLPLVNYLCYI